MARWNHTLDLSDVFHDQGRTFSERRDEIVRRIKAAPFYSWEISNLTDDLAQADTGDQWDEFWDQFYDWADEVGVWVVTR